MYERTHSLFIESRSSSGGAGLLNKVLYIRLRPEFQTLILKYSNFLQKIAPLSYTSRMSQNNRSLVALVVGSLLERVQIPNPVIYLALAAHLFNFAVDFVNLIHLPIRQYSLPFGILQASKDSPSGGTSPYCPL